MLAALECAAPRYPPNSSETTTLSYEVTGRGTLGIIPEFNSSALQEVSQVPQRGRT